MLDSIHSEAFKTSEHKNLLCGKKDTFVYSIHFHNVLLGDCRIDFLSIKYSSKSFFRFELVTRLGLLEIISVD